MHNMMMSSPAVLDAHRQALEFIETHEPEILELWAASLMTENAATPSRPMPETRLVCAEALRALRDFLKGDALTIAMPITSKFARVQLDGGASQVDIVVVLLQGRQVMLDLIHGQLSADAGARVSIQLGDAVDRMISLYGSVTCSICMARQDDRRVRVERQLESVVERSQDAIVLVDEAGVVRNWNPGATALFGYSYVEMIGQSLDRLWPPGYPRQEIGKLVEEVSHSGYARRPETQRIRRDGTPVTVDASYTAVVDPEGTRLGMWTIFRDITERQRLLEAKLQAERLAMIGTMSAKLAHEVRNPLTSIILNLEMIKDTLNGRIADPSGDSSESRELLASIESEVNRIHHVVEDYLRFARLPNLQLVPVQLDTFLVGQMSMLASELQQRRIELRLDPGVPGVRVAADEDQLWQAILNLVRNAMEAMPEGGVLDISSRIDGGRVLVIIGDSGCGMPEDVRARMFQPFYSTKRGGTGLGLPLTGQIVQEHGARLLCESAPGEGTRFTLEFPGAEPDPAGPSQGAGR